MHGREQSEADQPGAPVALLDADVGAKLPGQMDPVLTRTLAGEVEDVAGEPVWQVIGDRLWQRRQHDAEFLQPRFRTHGLLLYSLTRRRPASSPTIPRRKARTQATKIAPWITNTHWPSGAR